MAAERGTGDSLCAGTGAVVKRGEFEYTHPDEYDVTPDSWTLVKHPQYGTVVAAMMPYPVVHPDDPACKDDPAFVDDSIQFAHGDRSGAITDTAEGARMRAVCDSCVIQRGCAEYGIAHEQHLMLGGFTPAERARIRAERRQIVVPPHEADKYGLQGTYVSPVYTSGVAHA